MNKIFILSLFLTIWVGLYGQNNNIIFIAVDDLKPLLSNYGHKDIKTPNFDRLAAMGVTFTNAHAQQAVCGPSRASIMTGTCPDMTKVWDLHTDFRTSNPDLISMPEHLINKGYASAGIGKIYHKGSSAEGHDGKSWTVPHALPDGNDPVHGEPMMGYQDPKTKKALNLIMEELVAGGAKSNGSLRDKALKKLKPSTECIDISDEGYQDGAYTVEALKMMKTLAADGKPFFLAVGYQRPHLPFIAPKKYWDLYKRENIKLDPLQTAGKDIPKIAYHNYGELRAHTDIPQDLDFGEVINEDKQRELVHGYMASISYIDAQLGKLLDQYLALGLDKNTHIVLWGDHGFHLGDHTIWCKHSNFEQATRLPLMFAGPKVQKGKKVSQPVELLDVFPTLFELSGVAAAPQAEGVSLVPLMDQDPKTTVSKDYAISQYSRLQTVKGYSIRTDKYRYTEWHDNGYNSHKPYDNANIVAYELYDYEKDPTESQNWIDKDPYKATQSALKAKLLAHLDKKFVAAKSIKTSNNSNNTNDGNSDHSGSNATDAKKKGGKKQGNKNAGQNKNGKKNKSANKDQTSKIGKSDDQKKVDPVLEDQDVEAVGDGKKVNKRPNVLFIYADDLGYHDLGFTDSKIYNTPHIDKLAKQSIQFQNAYSSYPRCTPSRYGMITATYPVNEDHGNLAAIPKESNFIRQFDQEGYQTSYVGKWHLGGENNAPKGFGFDHSFAAGTAGGTATHFYPFNNNKTKPDPEKYIEDVTEKGAAGDYLADLLTKQTIDFIKNTDKEKPFFAMLAHYAVHAPIEAKPEDRARNAKEISAYNFGEGPEYIQEGTGRQKMRQDDPDYAGMVENLDFNVGRILSTLDELGISDNTIVVFSSDHGGLSNDGTGKERHLATTNLPLRAGKGHLYEGGIRVPLLIKWKNHLAATVDKKSIVIGMDIMPTLLDLAIDKKLANVDGKSLSDVMEGKQVWDERTLFWHEKKARPNSTGDIPCTAMRSGKYKLLHFFEEGSFELYDLSTDIGERKNIINDQVAIADKMKAELNAWKAEYLTADKMKKKAAKEGTVNENGEPKSAKSESKAKKGKKKNKE